jgi:hypothetical protein
MITEAQEEVDLDVDEDESHHAIDQLFQTGFRLLEVLEDEVEPRGDGDAEIRENDSSERQN